MCAVQKIMAASSDQESTTVRCVQLCCVAHRKGDVDFCISSLLAQSGQTAVIGDVKSQPPHDSITYYRVGTLRRRKVVSHTLLFLSEIQKFPEDTYRSRCAPANETKCGYCKIREIKYLGDFVYIRACQDGKRLDSWMREK